MKTYEADVIVVGAGASGLAAAITAGEQEASVAVFEKMSNPGGCANMASGPLGVESRIQKDLIVGLTKEEAVQEFMNYTHWLADERLVRRYIYKSGDTINWLEDMGVRFYAPRHYFPGSYETWHFVAPKEGPAADGSLARDTGAVMVQYMVDRATELGVEFCYNSKVSKILKDEDGVVYGIQGTDEEGEFQAFGGAVIIGTGGFGDNPEMMKMATNREWGDELFTIRIPGVTGDGIQMAWDAGAGKSRMSMELCYFAPNTLGYNDFEMPFRQFDLLVNLKGERFMNEEQMKNPVFTTNALMIQPKSCAWGIADTALIDHYRTAGPNVCMSNSIGKDYTDILWPELEKYLKERPDVLVSADSVEELAEKIGAPADVLKDTIEKYNQYCDQNVDEDFNKQYRYLHALKGPKYYACKFGLSGYGSLGGIKINYKTEVVDDDYNVIPGLYAVGSDANALYDPDYVFVLPGNTLGFALNSGRLAGEEAIEYIMSMNEEE